MDYFLLSGDKDYINCPVIKNIFENLIGNLNDVDDYSKINNNTVFTLTNKENIEYTDWIDRQILFVSKELKNLLQVYMPYMKFKNVLLHNKYNNSGQLYYVPMLKSVSCISEKSEWNFNKSGLKTIILNKEKIQDYPIFRLSDVKERYIIVRLDLLESMLRRDMEGFVFKKIQVE